MRMKLAVLAVCIMSVACAGNFQSQKETVTARGANPEPPLFLPMISADNTADGKVFSPYSGGIVLLYQGSRFHSTALPGREKEMAKELAKMKRLFPGTHFFLYPRHASIGEIDPESRVVKKWRWAPGMSLWYLLPGASSAKPLVPIQAKQN